MNLNDIPQFPKSNAALSISFRDLLKWVDQQVKEDGLDLLPDFQRGHVWTEEQRIRYIEYRLRGGDGGKAIYLNRSGWVGPGPDGPYQIIDGLQRLTSAMMFMKNELRAFGHLYKEFTGHLRNHVEFHWCIFELPTRADVLRYYLDLNAGGTQHAESEIARVRLLLQREQH
jgi:hypothetical protein